MQYPLLIFDWDGTLMDSASVIVSCLTQAIRDVGLSVPSAEAIRKTIGLGSRESLEVLFPEAEDSCYQHIQLRYREHFFASSRDQMPLFPDVVQVLTTLQQAGYLLTIATGKSRAGLNKAMVEGGVEDLFYYSQCADEAPSKPSPDMVLNILQHTGMEASDALVIGDSVYDMQMAENAKVAAVAVLTGIHQQQELVDAGALTCFSALTQLPDFLQTQQSKSSG